MAYFAAVESFCCDDCAQGRDCGSGMGNGDDLGLYLGDGLGFNIPDDSLIPVDTPDNADGSLLSFGTVENLSKILPAAFAAPANTTYTGEQAVDAAVQAAGLVAAPFTAGLSVVGASAAQAIEHMFKFGKGRKEADVITPNQNVVWQYIVSLSQVALASNDPVLLQQAVLNLQQLGYNWIRFLKDPRFIDGRASAQAANTIMPYLDGTCGYQPHVMVPTMGQTSPGQDSPCMPAGCGGCQNAWPHDWGYGAGLLGAIRARVVQNGGILPAANDVTQGVGVPTLQFPTTSGAINSVPQAGYVNNGNWSYGFQPVTSTVPPSVAGVLGLDSSTLGIVAAVLVGGFLLSRR